MLKFLLKKNLILILFLLISCSTYLRADLTLAPANTINNRLPLEVTNENSPKFNLEFEVEIENIPSGTIKKIFPNNEEIIIGKVLRPGKQLKIMNHFWAGHYLRAVESDGVSCVTAVGVNAIHFRVGDNAETYNPEFPEIWHPRIFDLAPYDIFSNTMEKFLDPAVIYTDIPGGEKIFGGDATPYPGNPVFYLNNNNEWETLDYYFRGNYEKELPIKIKFKVFKPVTNDGFPTYIEFENWARGDKIHDFEMANNGRVMLCYPNKEPQKIATVVKRVSKTGRFIGSEYAIPGTIRATHGGVICLSTSPKNGFLRYSHHELRGGIQIIPVNHAKYLYYNKLNPFTFYPQYMIIANTNDEIDILKEKNYTITETYSKINNAENNYQVEKIFLASNPFWEGVAPLFALYLKPSPKAYFIISTDFGITWQTCPEISGISNIPDNWTNIRIYPE